MNIRESIRENYGKLAPITEFRVPAYSERVDDVADQVVAGKLAHQGDYIEVGRKDIDWTAQHRNHHTWRSIPNRFVYLFPLISAFRETGEACYAEAARDYINDWLNAHPPMEDWQLAAYDNKLNLGIRVEAWLICLYTFLEAESWDDAFIDQVIASIRCQLNYVSGNLSAKGNFRMVQSMVLILCGLVFDWLVDAAGWVRYGVALMNDAGRRQILEDGVHVEVTPGYHSWMTKLFSNCLKLQRAFPALTFSFTPDQVLAMHDYLIVSTKPNGGWSGMQDCEGIFSGEKETPYFVDREAFCREFGLDPALPESASRIFPAAGQAFFRSGFERDSSYVSFDASIHGSAHGHLSRNSIQVHAHGRTILVDPGRMEYEMSNPAGPYGKSTRAHNTANLNGWNQFVTKPEEFRSFCCEQFGVATSTYRGGFWPAPYGWWFYEGMGKGLQAVHSRMIFAKNSGWIAVVDYVNRWEETGRGNEYENPALEVNWQFAPGDVTVNDDFTVRTSHENANLMMLFPLRPSNAVLNKYEGATEPLRGWVRDAAQNGFTNVPAPQVSMECRPMEAFAETMVTLIVPYLGQDAPDITAEVVCPDLKAQDSPHWMLKVKHGGCVEELYWTRCMDYMIGKAGGLETDGSVMYRRLEDNEPVLLAAADATYAIGNNCDTVIC